MKIHIKAEIIEHIVIIIITFCLFINKQKNVSTNNFSTPGLSKNELNSKNRND